ncbi:MAG TPA: Gp37 family protein [Candidatus Binataceae bacterium]|nr:Gp37 family protein [Candidatus Binataceae bacterium]
MGVMLDSPWAGQVFTPPTPVDIATLESAIAAQLRSQVAAIEVVRFPDKPAAYRLTHRIGAALVAWRGSTFGALIDTDAVVQTRRLEFEVSLLVRDLGWAFGADAAGPSPGAYALLEAVRAALTGFTVPGCRKMFPLREQFAGRDAQGGAWTWSTLYALDTIAMEGASVPNFPVLVRGVALEEGGQTSFEAAASAYTFNAQDLIQLPVGNIVSLAITPQGGGNAYVAGTDYALDAVNGIVARVATGTIPSGATIVIAYTYADSVVAIAGGSSSPTAPSN